MTTAGPQSPSTALDLLFGPDADAAGILAAEILSPGGDQSLGRALTDFSETTRKAAVREAAATAAATLQKIDLIGVLVRGWQDHRAIVGAARRTLAGPPGREMVSMAEHEITLDQRPYVSVLVDGRRVATLRLGLSVVFDVSAVLLLIERGRLTAVHSGHCDITATLTVQDTDLLVKKNQLELPGAKSLARAIRLLPASEYPATEDPTREDPAREDPAREDLSDRARAPGSPAPSAS